MKSLENKEIREEIIQIRNRIIENQYVYVEEYCVKAPIVLQKEIFELILSINKEITSYELMRSEISSCFEFLEPKLDRKSIIEKAKKGVDKLKTNYYSDLAYSFRFYLYGLYTQMGFDSIGQEFIELQESLYQKIYIQNHVEYSKIKGLMTLVEYMNNIPKEKVYHIHNLLEMKELLLQYETYLGSVLKVEDINLKRAVFSYLEDRVNFYFVDFI